MFKLEAPRILALAIGMLCLLPASLLAESGDSAPVFVPAQSHSFFETNPHPLHNAPSPRFAAENPELKPKRLERAERESLNRELRETLRNVYEAPKRRD